MTKPDELPQDQYANGELPDSAKTVVRVVYIMGIVMVVLFLVLIGSVIWKVTSRKPAPVNAGPATMNLALPAGTEVQSMVLDGDRLAVNTGREIIIVDVRKSVILSRVTIGAQ